MDGVRVKLWADGRVSVIMYRTMTGKVADDLGYKILEKFCLLDDGCWKLLAEGEMASFLTGVYRQGTDDFVV